MTAEPFVLTAREMAEAFGGVLAHGPETRPLPTVSIDTRTIAPGDLYVALRGPRFDGHAFVAQAIAAGAAGVAGVAAAAARPADGGDRLGLTMHPLSDDERRSTGLAVGMMVDAVHGPAASAGIRPGDVVLELNDTLLETPDDVQTLEANGGSVIAVLIQRDNARKFVSVHAR